MFAIDDIHDIEDIATEVFFMAADAMNCLECLEAAGAAKANTMATIYSMDAGNIMLSAAIEAHESGVSVLDILSQSNSKFDSVNELIGRRRAEMDYLVKEMKGKNNVH